MRVFFIIFLSRAIFGHPATHFPSFSFEASRSGGAPSMRLNLYSGESHRVNLVQCNVFRDIPTTSLDCAFLGSLENDPQSSVAVTGCLGAEPVHVTVMSDTLRGQFEMAIDGSVTEVPNPYGSGTGDVLAIPSDEGLAARANTISCKDFPETKGCTLPEEVTAEIKVHYDQSLQDKVGKDNVTNWINQVMCDAQPLFFHPTFPTKMKLQVIGDPVFYPDKYWDCVKGLYYVYNMNYDARGGDYAVDVHTIFVGNDGDDYSLGVAWEGTACLSGIMANGYGQYAGNINSNEMQSTTTETAAVFAHELGHNLGAPHNDYDRNCTGVMNSHATQISASNPWSVCTQEAIRNTYAYVIKMNNGKHCLEYEGGAPQVCPYSGIETYKGDGYCTDFLNHFGCDYDGGDCCNKSKPEWNKYCTVCKCYQE